MKFKDQVSKSIQSIGTFFLLAMSLNCLEGVVTHASFALIHKLPMQA